MKSKSLFEDILETALKSPIAGIVISSVFVVLGVYFISKTAPIGATPAETIFVPTYHMIGKVSFVAAAVILFVTGIGYVVTSHKKKQQTSFFQSRRTLEDIKTLSWREFEEFVGSLFEQMGYSVEVTGGLKDGGVDLIIRKDNRTFLVQCKNYRVSKVSLSMVRDFYGAMNANLNYESGYFITTGIFTLDAKKFAEDKPIELVDGARLMGYVEMTAGNDLPLRRPISRDRVTTTPTCPKCGSIMILRTAKRGDKAGQQFWGCSTYPKCKGTEALRV